MKKVNIVCPYSGWILDSLADQLLNLTYVERSELPNPKHHINYFINYNSYSRTDGITLAYFTHIEENEPDLTERFFDVANSVDILTTQSSKYQKILTQNHVLKPVHVISPGFDAKIFYPSPLRIGIAGRPYKSGRKREWLLEELTKIQGVELVLAGEDWEFNSKKYEINDLGNFYRSLDYYLVTSEYEGGPMPALEALACSVPVIAPNVGWMEDLPHIQYPNWDPLKAVRIIEGLSEKRKSLCSRVASRSWDNWILEHYRLFKSVLTIEKRSFSINNFQFYSQFDFEKTKIDFEKTKIDFEKTKIDFELLKIVLRKKWFFRVIKILRLIRLRYTHK